MKFKIGQRVKYRSVGEYTGERECTGIVVNIYPGGQKCTDSETGKPYIQPHSYAVKVDSIPEWWPYPGTDMFAPDEDSLSLA